MVFEEGPLQIGRNEPIFGAEPLDDPCVSRNQLAISWDGSYFKVRNSASARRNIRAFDVDGHTLGLDRIPPRCLLAIGNRIVLWLDNTARSTRDLGMIGHSSRMQALRSHIRRASRLGHTVFVNGEPGVGKDLAAAAIHNVSRYSEGPFVSVDCGALPPPLAESQLFGKEGAAGLLASAAGGCLFLDDIAELPLALQARVLEFLLERPVDFMLVATSHRHLPSEVEAGRFDDGLYERIERPAVTVPPLRDRPEDTPVLFAHFLAIHADTLPHLIREATVFDPPVALEYILGLMVRDWQHNVAQLRREVTGVAMANGEPGPFKAPDESATMSIPPADSSDEIDLDRDGLLSVLREHSFVHRQVAAALGISRTALEEQIEELGIRGASEVTDVEIQGALDACGGDVARAAAVLQISRRDLALRIAAPRSAE